jgi:single-strand DNA-binding protein
MLNKAVLMGRLVRDPELRQTQSGMAVASFTIAVDRAPGKDGQRVTDFIDIVAWNKTAEMVTKWFTKGRMIAVSGRIQVRNWEDKQGQKRKAVEVVADEVSFCGDSKPEHDAQKPESKFETASDDGDLPF